VRKLKVDGVGVSILDALYSVLSLVQVLQVQLFT
jgi:hypothetical protein